MAILAHAEHEHIDDAGRAGIGLVEVGFSPERAVMAGFHRQEGRGFGLALQQGTAHQRGIGAFMILIHPALVGETDSDLFPIEIDRRERLVDRPRRGAARAEQGCLVASRQGVFQTRLDPVCGLGFEGLLRAESVKFCCACHGWAGTRGAACCQGQSVSVCEGIAMDA